MEPFHVRRVSAPVHLCHLDLVGLQTRLLCFVWRYHHASVFPDSSDSSLDQCLEQLTVDPQRIPCRIDFRSCRLPVDIFMQERPVEPHRLPVGLHLLDERRCDTSGRPYLSPLLDLQ